MKPTKPALNSFRKLISRKSFKDIGKGSEMGRVIIPVSEQDNSIRLPEVENTTTYSILKTEEMQGNLEIVNDSIKGSFKGMLFNKNGATLSIVPISVPTQSFTLNSTSTNGASVNFLSDGADWFIWGMMADGAVDAKATGDFGSKKEGDINNNVSARTDEILEEQGLGTENPDPAVVEAIEESTQTETPAPVYPPDAPTLEAGEGYLSDGETTNSNSWVVGGSDVLPGSTVTVAIYDGLNVEESSETITVGEDGTWTSTTDTSLWSDDTYTVSVIITNPNTGLTSDPAEITVTRDATPPVITISETSPYGFEVGNAGPTAPSATADDGSTVTNDWNETTLNALTEGQTATITYTATDAAGNVGTATLTVEAQAVVTELSFYRYDNLTDQSPLAVPEYPVGSTPTDLVWSEEGLNNLLRSATSDTTYAVRTDAYDLNNYDELEIKFIMGYGNFGLVYTDDQPGQNGILSGENWKEMRYHIASFGGGIEARYLGVNQGDLSGAPSIANNVLSIKINRLDLETGYVTLVLYNKSADLEDTSVLNSIVMNTQIDMTKSIYFISANDAASTDTTDISVIETVNSGGIFTQFIEEGPYLANGINSLSSVSNGILSTGTRTYTSFNVNQTSYFQLGRYTPYSTVDPTNVVTYSIWFRKTGDSYVSGVIDNSQFAVFIHQTAYRAVGIRIQTNDQVQIGGEISYPFNWRGTPVGTLSQDINNGIWHHIAISFSVNLSNLSDVNIVIDGVAQTTINDPGLLNLMPANETRYTFVGVDNTQTLYSTGDFDSFEIVKDIALTTAQMQSLYNAGRGQMSIEQASQIEALAVETSIWIEEDYATIPDPQTATLNNGILEITALQTGGTEPSLVPSFALGDLLVSGDVNATYSIWFKKTGDSYSNDSVVANYFPIFGFDNIAESISVKIENGTQVMIQGVDFPNWTQIATMPSSIEDGQWHNLIISHKKYGTKRVANALVDGQSLGFLSLNNTNSIAPSDPNQLMGIGFHSNATGVDAYSTGHFDSFEIIRNEGLMISQMIELFAAGRGNSQITALADTSIGKVISDDLFNSIEKHAHGTAPIVDVSNDKRYSFGGAGGFAYHNGYKYDMFNFTNRADATNSFSYSGSTRTFSTWFNASNVTGRKTLFSKFQSRHGDIGWFIRINNGVLQAIINGDVNATYGNGTTEPYIQANTWYHLVVVFKHLETKIYLNGVLVKTNTDPFYNSGRGFQSAANSTKTNATDQAEYYYDGKGAWDNYLIRFAIGSVGIAGESNSEIRTDYFIGEMAYPEAYLDELSATEITDIYNSQNGTL